MPTSGATPRVNAPAPPLLAQVVADGTHAHPQPHALVIGHALLRDLADAAHQLCMLHGRHPDVIERAAAHPIDAASAAWLNRAVHGFAGERAYLVALVAAAGPLPSTPGQAETEAVVTAQRHALAMLSQSDRPGCALGAAVALVLDWQAIRTALDHGAERMGLPVPPSTLPDREDTLALLDELAGSAAPVGRAMLFGAQQMLAQHRGLWDLLQARAEARAR